MAERICPHCKNPIYDDDALLCHFCGESLQYQGGVMGKLKYGHKALIAVLAVILGLMLFWLTL